jgi:hypothetical protein
MMIPIDFHYWPVDEPFLPGLVVDIPEWTFEKKRLSPWHPTRKKDTLV